MWRFFFVYYFEGTYQKIISEGARRLPQVFSYLRNRRSDPVWKQRERARCRNRGKTRRAVTDTHTHNCRTQTHIHSHIQKPTNNKNQNQQCSFFYISLLPKLVMKKTKTTKRRRAADRRVKKENTEKNRILVN